MTSRDDPPRPDALSDAIRRCGLQLHDEQVELLDRYRSLLWDWNRKVNLTRHTTLDLFVQRDLVDTVQLARLLDQEEEVLDVGAGGGAIGVILSILRPDLDVSLCESVGKKARALQDMVRRLELPAAVHHARAEDLLDDLRFTALVARAVGPLWKMCKWFEPHWDSIGRLLVIKGPRWIDERKQAREKGLLKKLELRRAAAYPLPSGGESVILKLWPRGTGKRPPPSSVT